MARNTAQYGKENVQLVGKAFNKIVQKKPLLELPDNIRIRSRSTSGVPGQPLPATKKICSKQYLNKLCRNEIHAILQENPISQCLCPEKPRRQPKSADYVSSEGKFDFGNVEKRIVRPTNRVADKIQIGEEQNGKLALEKVKRDTKVRRRNIEKNYVRRGSYRDDFYNLEYIEDIMATLGNDESKLVVRANYVDTKILDSKMRIEVVDWMLSLQTTFGFSNSEFYLAVNLLDQVLASRARVPGNLYRLLMLTTIWLASKMIGSGTFRAAEMIKYSCTSYIPQQLIKMEQKVLILLNYHVHTIEPTIVTNYYLKLFNIDSIELARKSVYYILDCATLLSEFSRYPISIIGAAAVTVTIKFYFPELEEKMKRYFTQKLSTDYMSRKMCFESMLFTQVINMRNNAYEFRQPYYKYKMNNEIKDLV